MRHFLENVTGLEIYPLISFVIFIVFFVWVTLRVATRSRREVAEMSQIPLLESNHESKA